MEFDELLKLCQEHADRNGIQLNSDKKVVEMLLKGLLANEEKKGKRYCPCRVLTGNQEEDDKKVCPCVWHMDEIKKMGHCLCNLFFKKDGV